MLAVKILEAAGCEVAALTFESPFFTAEKAEISAHNLGIELFVEDFSDAILTLVKNPPHGFGKNLNPCLDCHAAMFRRAADFAAKNNFQIIASGEVLGQRPFSQNAVALRRVAKIAGVEILRPLSAKLLAETSFEKNGLIERAKLLDLSGRSRQSQFELATKFGVRDFPMPAGGCLLTEPTFAEKLKILLERDADATAEDVNMLKIGRFMPLGTKSFAVFGRDFAENERLEALANSTNYVIQMTELVGPSALVKIQQPDDFAEIFPLVATEIRRRGRDSKNSHDKIKFTISGAISESREI